MDGPYPTWAEMLAVIGSILGGGILVVLTVLGLVWRRYIAHDKALFGPEHGLVPTVEVMKVRMETVDTNVAAIADHLGVLNIAGTVIPRHAAPGGGANGNDMEDGLDEDPRGTGTDADG